MAVPRTQIEIRDMCTDSKVLEAILCRLLININNIRIVLRKCMCKYEKNCVYRGFLSKVVNFFKRDEIKIRILPRLRILDYDELYILDTLAFKDLTMPGGIQLHLYRLIVPILGYKNILQTLEKHLTMSHPKPMLVVNELVFDVDISNKLTARKHVKPIPEEMYDFFEEWPKYMTKWLETYFSKMQSIRKIKSNIVENIAISSHRPQMISEKLKVIELRFKHIRQISAYKLKKLYKAVKKWKSLDISLRIVIEDVGVVEAFSNLLSDICNSDISQIDHLKLNIQVMNKNEDGTLKNIVCWIYKLKQLKEVAKKLDKNLKSSKKDKSISKNSYNLLESQSDYDTKFDQKSTFIEFKMCTKEALTDSQPNVDAS